MEQKLNTYLDCIPCFFRQALAAARSATGNEDTHRRVLDSIAEMVRELPLDVSPPQIGQQVYKRVAQITGISDPYRAEKLASNRAALALYPALKRTVAASKDGLRTACSLAIAGNAIDLGAQSECAEVSNVMNIASSMRFGIDHYSDFADALRGASRILYLADNAGEIVFDRILIEEILRIKKLEIHFAVRGSPVINDATTEDAEFVGIGTVASIVSNGSDAPATVLPLCSSELLELYRSADVIVSKGQGNYESLSGQQEPIFFMLRVKCMVAAKLVGAEIGDAILMRQSPSMIPNASSSPHITDRAGGDSQWKSA